MHLLIITITIVIIITTITNINSITIITITPFHPDSFGAELALRAMAQPERQEGRGPDDGQSAGLVSWVTRSRL